MQNRMSSGMSRSNRVGSFDISSPGAPFEDLRRRLAAINGSASSLAHGSREIRGTWASSVNPLSSMLSQTAVAGPVERPSSPTDSVVSVANSSAPRGQRLQVGSMDGQKAAPAVGSSKANATGHLESTSRIRSDGSPERSGRSSPVSVAGTVRGAHRSRVPSMLPISTYGV